jgi:indole-3-glycerol phosphate synthase
MYLEKIVETKREEVAKLKEKKISLKDTFKKGKLTLIAEIKKASPSKGIISTNFDPQRQLELYIKGGADAISILTDEKYFQGSTNILKELRTKTNLPILRKDFIIDPIQIYQSLFLGANVILLIASILTKKEISDFLKISKDIGLEAIVEVHNPQELTKVLDTETEILGINNRDLNDFSVSLRNTEKLLEELEKLDKRKDFYVISESGIKEKSDIDYLRSLGVDGVLIGEALMKENDPVLKIGELFPEKRSNLQ